MFKSIPLNIIFFRLTWVFRSWWQGGKERENISFERLSLKGISFRRQISSQQWDSRADKLDCASSRLSCWSRPHRVSPENSICERKPWPRPSPPRSPGPASQPGGSLRKLCSPKKKKIGADDVGAPVQNRLSRASHRRLISLANLYLSQHKQKYTWKGEGNTGKCKHGRKQSTKVQGQNRPAQPKAGWINRTVWGNLLIQMKSKQNGLTTSLLASN